MQKKHVLFFELYFPEEKVGPPNANSWKERIFSPFKPSTLEMWEEEGLFSSRKLSTHILWGRVSNTPSPDAWLTG